MFRCKASVSFQAAGANSEEWRTFRYAAVTISLRQCYGLTSPPSHRLRRDKRMRIIPIESGQVDVFRQPPSTM